MKEWLVILVGLAIVFCFLAWNGTLQQTAETTHETVKTVCEARETALNNLEMAAIWGQIRFMPPEDREFLVKIYDTGRVSYCDVDKLQKLLGADKLKSIDRLRDFPCEAYVCLTGG